MEHSGRKKGMWPDRRKDMCSNVGVGVCSTGLEDSQALSRDPLEVRREVQGDSERWVMEGLECRLRVALLATGQEQWGGVALLET